MTNLIKAYTSRVPFKARLHACRCGKMHAEWWKTTPPPGCKSAA